MISFEEAKEKYKKMYFSLISKYYKNVSSEEFEDLCQKGDIAIWEALESYSSDKGASLGTHVYNTIYFNFINTRGDAIGISRSKFSRMKKKGSLPQISGFDDLAFFIQSKDKVEDTGLIIDSILNVCSSKQAYIIDLLINDLDVKDVALLLGMSKQGIWNQIKNLQNKYNEIYHKEDV